MKASVQGDEEFIDQWFLLLSKIGPAASDADHLHFSQI